MNAMYLKMRFSFVAQNHLVVFKPLNECRWISAYPSTTKRPSSIPISAKPFSSASCNSLYNINSLTFSLSVLFPITSTVDLRQEHPRFESNGLFHHSILPLYIFLMAVASFMHCPSLRHPNCVMI